MPSKELTRVFDESQKFGELHLQEWWDAFRKAQTVGHPDYFTPPQAEPDRHYDRNGYCDNPARGY